MYLTLKINRKKALLIVFLLFLSGCSFLLFPGKSTPTWSSTMNYKVVVDAGHGSIDSGASSGSLKEKDINLAVARTLSAELKKYNFYPIMTRTEDKLYQNSRNKDIRHRVELTRESGADLFISLHVNKYPSSQPSGSQVFYKPGCLLSKSLADSIREELLKLRPVNNRSLKTGDFYVLNGAACPAVLIELGFISNPQDRQYLADPDYQQQLASAVRMGIIHYLQSRFGKKADELPEPAAAELPVSGPPCSVYFLEKQGDIVFSQREIELPPDLTSARYSSQLTALYALRNLCAPPEGLMTLLPPGSEIRSLKIANGVAVIDFSEEIRENFQGGGGSEAYLIETISRTLFSIPGIQGIEILIAGERGASIGGHIYLKQLRRDSSISTLKKIY